MMMKVPTWAQWALRLVRRTLSGLLLMGRHACSGRPALGRRMAKVRAPARVTTRIRRERAMPSVTLRLG